jgi:hypothetical protein
MLASAMIMAVGDLRGRASGDLFKQDLLSVSHSTRDHRCRANSGYCDDVRPTGSST